MREAEDQKLRDIAGVAFGPEFGLGEWNNRQTTRTVKCKPNLVDEM